MNSSSSGMRSTRNRVLADADLGERHRLRWLVARARDRVSVRARRGVVEHADHGLLDGIGDHVFPAAGLGVRLRRRQAEDIREDPLGQPVPAHDPFGQPLCRPR